MREREESEKGEREENGEKKERRERRNERTEIATILPVLSSVSSRLLLIMVSSGLTKWWFDAKVAVGCLSGSWNQSGS